MRICQGWRRGKHFSEDERMDEGTSLKDGEKGGGRGGGGKSISEWGTSILCLLKVFSGDDVKISTDIHRILIDSPLPFH